MPKRSRSIAAKAKLIRVKKITRKQALSYNRTIPNGMGVTAISAVNGRGSYASRYAATRSILAGAEPNGDGMFFYKNRHKRGVKLKGKAKTAFLRQMAAGRKAAASRKKKSVKRKTMKRNRMSEAARASLFASPETASRYRDLMTGRRTVKAGSASASLGFKVAKPKKKKKAAAKKVAKKSAPKKAKRNLSRVKTVYSSNRSRKRKYRRNEDELPPGIAGVLADDNVIYPAAVAPAAAAPKKKKRKKPGPVTARRYGGKFKTTRQHVKGGFLQQLARVGGNTYRTYMYTTASGKTRKIPEWAIAGAKSAKAYRGPTKRAAALGARRQRIAEIVKKKILQGRYPFTPNTMTFREWKKTMKKNRKTKRKGKKHYHRNAVLQAAANPLMQAAANGRRKRKSKKARRNARKGGLKMLRMKRHSRIRRNGVASYISNLGAGSADQIVAVLKTGVVVTAGLVTHKALTALLIENVEFFQTTKFGKSIASVAVAALGIPAAGMVKGAVGSQVQIGMGASVVHSVLVDLLGAAGQSKLVSYLGDYTEASRGLPAAGYGSYYEFSPGQQYSGMGAYYEFAPGQQYSGMGEYIETGTSGFGDYMQAAAGFGSPALMQAAAGVGEYIVTGAQGIGEYEQVQGEYTQPSVTNEGIAPSLSAAEQALTIAEAAAGVGGMGNVDAGLQQIVYPQGQALDIGDQPGGSRAGVFYGGNGVFGP